MSKNTKQVLFTLSRMGDVCEYESFRMEELRAICSALRASPPPIVVRLVQGVTVKRDSFRDCVGAMEGIGWAGFSSAADDTSLGRVSLGRETEAEDEDGALPVELLSGKLLVVVVVGVVSVSAVTCPAI